MNNLSLMEDLPRESQELGVVGPKEEERRGRKGWELRRGYSASGTTARQGRTASKTGANSKLYSQVVTHLSELFFYSFSSSHTGSLLSLLLIMKPSSSNRQASTLSSGSHTSNESNWNLVPGQEEARAHQTSFKPLAPLEVMVVDIKIIRVFEVLWHSKQIIIWFLTEMPSIALAEVS
ncbi:hypothetical protein MUG91_G2n5 [Manis pentadactyla]|nr:hypothetical protein MUG91_G2n5 [Manis pentadactyla]